MIKSDNWVKWLMAVVGTILASWMGFITYTQVSMSNSITELITDMKWLKDEGRILVLEEYTKALHSHMETNRERIIVLETKIEERRKPSLANKL